MKKLLLLCACLLALLVSPGAAYAGDPNVVVVRIVDNGARIVLAICRPDGTTETARFNSGTGQRLVEAGQGCQGVIQKLYKEGYSLKSTFTTGTASTTLVFVKE